MNKSIFKAYDIRGIYPDNINANVVTTIGKACARLFDEGEIIIGYDARHGSAELSHILEKSIVEEANLLHKKITIQAIGFSTTPMFYFVVNYCNARGGCMITASHNPKNYNGIKVVREGAEMVAGTDILKIVETL